MAITVSINRCTTRLQKEVWQIWRTFPQSLSCSIIEAHLAHFKDREDDDEVEWREKQVAVLERLLHDVPVGMAVVHSKNNFDDLVRIRGGLLEHRPTSGILWKRGIPLPMKRNYVILRERDDIDSLVSSLAWTEDQGTFVLLSATDDAQAVSRFIGRKWTAGDCVVGIGIYGESPNWMVVSNHLTDRDLHQSFADLFR